MDTVDVDEPVPYRLTYLGLIEAQAAPIEADRRQAESAP